MPGARRGVVLKIDPRASLDAAVTQATRTRACWLAARDRRPTTCRRRPPASWTWLPATTPWRAGRRMPAPSCAGPSAKGRRRASIVPAPRTPSMPSTACWRSSVRAGWLPHPRRGPSWGAGRAAGRQRRLVPGPRRARRPTAGWRHRAAHRRAGLLPLRRLHPRPAAGRQARIPTGHGRAAAGLREAGTPEPRPVGRARAGRRRGRPRAGRASASSSAASWGRAALATPGTFDLVIDPRWNRLRDLRERLRGRRGHCCGSLPLDRLARRVAYHEQSHADVLPRP